MRSVQEHHDIKHGLLLDFFLLFPSLKDDIAIFI